MAIIKPCPNCQNDLEIPQPVPEMIVCPSCGAGIKKKTTAANSTTVTAMASGHPPQASPPATTPAPRSRSHLLLFGLVAGMLFLGCLPLGGLGIAWVITGPTEQAKSDDPPEDDPIPPPVVEPPTPVLLKEKAVGLPPSDPRIQAVQPAVDKGVAYLKSKVPELAGMRGGYVGLSGLTLLECGVPPDDPAVLKIAELIRKDAPEMKQVYDLSASLFFLNRWDESRPLDDRDRAMARSFALRIIAGQLSSGIWSYSGVVMGPEKEAKFVASLQDGTYKPNYKSQKHASMSNTQFAMLAVWGSRKHGVPVRDPLLALAAYFHNNQNRDGSWIYPGNSLKATSTCAGLLALAIESAILEDKEFAPGRRQPVTAKKTADVDRAFAFVAKTIGRKKGDPGGGANSKFRVGGGGLFNADAIGDLYFLWTLERVGVVYSKDVIGGKDWFDWGHPIVLKAQRPDGSWHEKHPVNFGPMADTPFALLFLKRANIARDLTEIIRTRDGKVISTGK